MSEIGILRLDYYLEILSIVLRIDGFPTYYFLNPLFNEMLQLQEIKKIIF